MLRARKAGWIVALALGWMSLAGNSARAQVFDEGVVPSDEPTVRYTSVSFIDSAFPVTTYRVRFDAMYGADRPTRAEYIWAKPGLPAPGGPGVPLSETVLDYQEVSNYFEVAFANRFSVFGNIPVRFTNPQVNGNAEGLGDVDAGFKFCYLCSPQWIASFQFRTYIPTGASNIGLGTEHVSLEPAFLFNFMPSNLVTLESEIRYWIPVGGTDYAGDVIRYGLGASLGTRDTSGWWVTPVVETVGWTALGGLKQGFDFPNPVTVTPARGDTIVNIYAGVRAGLADRLDFYGGYGRALTGEVWYTDTWRFEFRFLF